MKKRLLLVPACFIVFLCAGASIRSGLQASPQSAAADVSAQRALIDKYCVTCHNQRVKTAGLALDTADLANVPAQSDIWEKVIRKLRTREMPPPKMPRPDDVTYDSLAAYLESTLDQAAAARPKAALTSGSPRGERATPCASKSPTTATATEPISRRARRPASVWRTFATGCRRPMAAHIVSRPDRTSGGALALSSRFPLKPETRPNEHSDHFGRRRTACHARLAAEVAGA